MPIAKFCKTHTSLHTHNNTQRGKSHTERVKSKDINNKYYKSAFQSECRQS